MNQVEEALNALIQSIKSSPEYTRYQDISARVHEQPELERQMNQFRRENFEAQNATGIWDLYERMDKLEKDYEDFRRRPLVREFLAAELALCRQLQNINLSIIRNIDFDVGFIDL